MSDFTDPLKALYLEWGGRFAADPEMPLNVMRDMQEAWHTVAVEAPGVSYETVDVDGIPAIWAIPAEADPARAMLFTHGGGFAAGSPASHRKLAGHIANAFGGRVLVIDYRRVPEAFYPAQTEDAVTAYRWLTAQGHAPEKIVTAGDSAGGTIALATVVSLRDQGLPQPGAVFAMSPGLDWEGLWMDNEDTDALASKALVVGMGANAFAGRDPKDPLCNPVYADLRGFPPVYISAGGAENLVGAARRFTEVATEAGVDVRLDVAPDRQHAHTFAAGNDPEADRTIAEFGEWVSARL
ncbi:MAG: alpha/beta hydrolase [Gordonia sp. (in: high G+C Gram-positive bacteria)]|uniref:alpha/beta hydrolase n=1 Tax=Gordonia sp. (in: high G+C Gram-positive bacteria) TaxID=84139 RepID=UPI0039E230C0